MEVIYNILEINIPFDFITYNFMKNAILAIILISPIFAILGTMIVNNKMAFFSDALGHSALTGIAIGMLFGLSNINISMVLGLVPTVGVPLPLMSFGGSSLLSLMFGFGLCENAHIHKDQQLSAKGS